MASKPGAATPPSFVEKPFIRQDPDGTKLRFECRIASTTEPEVTWFHNDLKVKPTPRHLIVMKLDNGNYLATLDILEPGRKDTGKFDVRVKTASGECKNTVFSYIEA